ncbi:hypothetical protein [Frankia sp. Cas3]|uniref:hypothetical protein n=1 Tax=Frankia sp. Cas3 TaxID=3073926 RepID=UPI002AD1D20B|nr:hypothetical protein [Frankia sp. Cas3]
MVGGRWSVVGGRSVAGRGRRASAIVRAAVLRRGCDKDLDGGADVGEGKCMVPGILVRVERA